MNSKPGFLCSVAALFAALAGGTAVAHNPMGGEKAGQLTTLAEQSNLVFTGRVAKVEYRNIESSGKEEGALPHTFVTYQIDNVLRGRAPGKTFTMAFIGGSDGMGHFLEANGVPTFEAGDRDILFVSGNGSEGSCPLVQCEYGRFRVHENGVFNTKGAPVRAVLGSNVIARGVPPRAFRTFSYPAPAFDDLMRNPEVKEMLSKQGMSMDEARARYEKEAPKQITLMADTPDSTGKPDSAGDATVKPGVKRLQRIPREQIQPRQLDKGALQQQGDRQLQTQPTLKKAPVVTQIDPRLAIATTPDDLPEGPMAIEEFVQHVRAVLEKTKRKPADIASINLDAKIRVAGPVMRQPVSAIEERAVVPEMTDADKKEVEMLQKQDFNPVLKRQ